MKNWLRPLPYLAACAIVSTSGAIAAEPAPSTPPGEKAGRATAPSGMPAATILPPSDPRYRPPKIPAAAFASQNAFGNAKLAPGGKQFAVRATLEGKIYVLLFDTATRKLNWSVGVGEQEQLQWYRWVADDKMLFSLSKVGMYFDREVRYTRLYLYDMNTRAFTFVGKQTEGPEGDDVLYIDPAGAYLLLSIQKTAYDWPSVWRFPLETGAEKKGVRVQAERTGIWEWYADDAGAVRMGAEFSQRTLKVWYRKNPQDDLKMVVKLTEDDAKDKWLDVERIVGGSDEGYVLERDGATMVLRKFNYATRTSGEIVYRNSQWDVNDADIAQDGTPIAAYYTDDKDRVEWLDPKFKSIQRRLEKALPGSDVWVVSRARDDSHMLVSASREDDPGALFIYTAADRSLAFFENFRPAIVPAALVAPRPIRFLARDKTAIRGYLTLPRGREVKGLPLIILPHGGPYGIRDKLAYDDEVQFLANRGYAVLQPNYRGSGGFGEDFEILGRGQIGRAMQDDIDDAMDWAVKEGIADPARVCVVGSSYGGYAALWAVIRNPERYRCAASFAGVTDWKRQIGYNGNFLNSKGRKAWRTHVIGEDAAFDLDTVSPYRQVARLTRPVLLAHGDKDSNVPFSQFKIMRDAAAQARVPLELLVFAGEGHGFAKPENEQRWYESLEAFLTRNNPAD